MKKILFVCALALCVAAVAGCKCSKYTAYDNQVTTIRYNPNPICPPPPTPCPPVINSCTPAPQPVQYVPAPQPACPLPNNACSVPQPQLVSSVLPPQQPFVPGGVTYANQPIQVSGANTVQYYNPYAVAPRMY